MLQVRLCALQVAISRKFLEGWGDDGNSELSERWSHASFGWAPDSSRNSHSLCHRVTVPIYYFSVRLIQMISRALDNVAISEALGRSAIILSNTCKSAGCARTTYDEPQVGYPSIDLSIAITYCRGELIDHRMSAGIASGVTFPWILRVIFNKPSFPSSKVVVYASKT